MIIDCICGKKKFKLADGVMPQQGSKVRCGSCSEVWFYHPDQGNNPINQDDNVNEEQNSLIENENDIGENKEIFSPISFLIVSATIATTGLAFNSSP